MAELSAELGLVKNGRDVALPPPGGPPVEMLAVHEGFKCSICPYAARVRRTVVNHLKVHKDDPSGPGQAVAASIQTFFDPHPRRFFAVNPALAPVDNRTPYQIFLQKVLPVMPQPFKPMSTEKSDVDPLVQMTRWHIHVEPFIQSQAALNNVISLARSPEKTDPIYGTLHDNVREYLKATRTAAHGVQFTVLCMLDHYPL